MLKMWLSQPDKIARSTNRFKCRYCFESFRTLSLRTAHKKKHIQYIHSEGSVSLSESETDSVYYDRRQATLPDCLPTAISNIRNILRISNEEELHHTQKKHATLPDSPPTAISNVKDILRISNEAELHDACEKHQATLPDCLPTAISNVKDILCISNEAELHDACEKQHIPFVHSDSLSNNETEKFDETRTALSKHTLASEGRIGDEHISKETSISSQRKLENANLPDGFPIAVVRIKDIFSILKENGIIEREVYDVRELQHIQFVHSGSLLNSETNNSSTGTCAKLAEHSLASDENIASIGDVHISEDESESKWEQDGATLLDSLPTAVIKLKDIFSILKEGSINDKELYDVYEKQHIIVRSGSLLSSETNNSYDENCTMLVEHLVESEKTIASKGDVLRISEEHNNSVEYSDSESSASLSDKETDYDERCATLLERIASNIEDTSKGNSMDKEKLDDANEKQHYQSIDSESCASLSDNESDDPNYMEEDIISDKELDDDISDKELDDDTSDEELDDDAPYKCGQCEKSYIRHWSFIEHQKIHPPIKPYKCELCEKSFAKKTHLTNHQRTHTGEKTCHCKICGKGLSYNYFKAHVKNHLGIRPYKCKQCKACFSLKSQLSRHESFHLRAKSLSCKQCDVKFTQMNALKSHIKEKHDPECEKFKCEICDKFFTRKRNLTVHLKRHTGKKDFQCYVCKKTFLQKSELRNHQVIHYLSMRSEVTCEKCGLTFSQPKCLRRHLKTHDENNVSFECKLCKKFYSNKSNLQQHMLTHTNPITFRCKVCGQRFQHRDLFFLHMRQHRGGKILKCPHCEKTYFRRDHWKRHLITHTMQHPFKCFICNISYKYDKALHCHQTVFHKNACSK